MLSVFIEVFQDIVRFFDKMIKFISINLVDIILFNKICAEYNPRVSNSQQNKQYEKIIFTHISFGHNLHRPGQ